MKEEKTPNAPHVQTAKVFTDYDGVTHSIDYASNEELMTANVYEFYPTEGRRPPMPFGCLRGM